MPKPSEIVNNMLGEQFNKALEFIVTPPKEKMPTMYEEVKLNTQRVQEETLKKQQERFLG